MATRPSTTSSNENAGPEILDLPVAKGKLAGSPEYSTVNAISENVQESGAGPALVKKSDLIERVMRASGAKRRDVKVIMEATLAELGRALAAGEEMSLPPLGKVRVQKHKSGEFTDILTLKLRRQKPGKARKPGKEGLAPGREAD
ncbi:MAG: HU family DNA-binding protein [Pseudorhodobacter sp.]